MFALYAVVSELLDRGLLLLPLVSNKGKRKKERKRKQGKYFHSRGT